MNKPKKVKKDEDGLLLPDSLELESEYINRFRRDAEMKAIIPNNVKRLRTAIKLFNNKFKNALVTVKLDDGTRYFIE